MSRNLAKLNDLANNKFEQLKQQKFATESARIQQQISPRSKTKINLPEELDDLKLPEKSLSGAEFVGAKERIDIIDIINMLELPSNLSLAVSFVVLSKEKGKENIQKAIQILEGEL